MPPASHLARRGAEVLTGEEVRVMEIAREILTPLQFDALRLHAQGLGYQRIALIQGVSRETARARVRRAVELVARATDGGRA
jgi:DNA-binding CsgD family transcriptional regulator